MVWNDSSFFQLSLNLLGYAYIAVPGGLLVYFLKKTEYLESQRNTCIWKCLQSFVHGNEDLEEEAPVSSPTEAHVYQKTIYRTAYLLVFCFTGLQVSYLTWGILQEKIMTQKYHNLSGEEKKFQDSQFLVFVNRVLAFIFSATYILIVKQPRHKAPLYKYSYCSFSNIMSSWCQYEALKYVSFPTQVLAKASKIIPVMLMGKVVSRKTYKLEEYVTALMISFGMVLFLLSRDEGKAQFATATTATGVIILLAYMLSDSFTSNWQGELFKKYHMSSVQMMCGVNFFSCILTAVSLLQHDGFANSSNFFLTFPDFFVDCIILSICSAIGQLFIFYTISKFGPVAFVIMMTVRQALAILLSCIIYNHRLTSYGVIGVILVFVSVFLRIYLNYKSKSQPKTISNEQKV